MINTILKMQRELHYNPVISFHKPVPDMDNHFSKLRVTWMDGDTTLDIECIVSETRIFSLDRFILQANRDIDKYMEKKEGK